MGLKTFEIDFEEFSKEKTFRNDMKYHEFVYNSNWNLFKVKNKMLISLKYILIGNYKNFEFEDGEEYKGISTGQNYIDEDGYIIDYQIITINEHPNRLKYKISPDNILISSLKLAKSPALCFENFNLSKYVFSNGFYIFKVNNNWNKKFILYILKNKKLKHVIDNNIYRGIGISSYKEEDLLKIKIPLISIKKQDQIIAKIELIEKKIKDLKGKIIPQHEIINKIFAREFCFDENLYNEFGKGMTAGTQTAKERELRIFNIDFTEFEKSPILRFSYRYHNIPTKKLMNLLSKQKTLKLKDFIYYHEKGIQPIYTSNNEIPVVKIANLKNGYIDFSESEYITYKDFSQINNCQKLKKFDILICGTGKISLGKIDIFEDEIDTLTTVDNIVLRLNEKYNPYFFVYYFRSILGFFQIERDYSGTTNQIHLYWEQISNFQIPDIPLSHQQKIVYEIKKELDKQEKIKIQISNLRNEIDKIIENSIKN